MPCTHYFVGSPSNIQFSSFFAPRCVFFEKVVKCDGNDFLEGQPIPIKISKKKRKWLRRQKQHDKAEQKKEEEEVMAEHFFSWEAAALLPSNALTSSSFSFGYISCCFFAHFQSLSLSLFPIAKQSVFSRSLCLSRTLTLVLTSLSYMDWSAWLQVCNACECA